MVPERSSALADQVRPLTGRRGHQLGQVDGPLVHHDPFGPPDGSGSSWARPPPDACCSSWSPKSVTTGAVTAPAAQGSGHISMPGPRESSRACCWASCLTRTACWRAMACRALAAPVAAGSQATP